MNTCIKCSELILPKKGCECEGGKPPFFPPAGSASDGDQYNELKLEINRLIWQYAPDETPLGTADEMACKILNSILAGKYLVRHD